MGTQTSPKTVREALLSMLKAYEEEVRSGRHVPPPLPIEELNASQFADPGEIRT
jgi:hypothetical protein